MFHWRVTNGNLLQTSDRRKPKYESESDMSNGYEMKEKDRTYESSLKVVGDVNLPNQLILQINSRLVRC